MDVLSKTEYTFLAVIKGIVAGLVTLIGAVIGHSFILFNSGDFPITNVVENRFNSLLLYFIVIVITAIFIGELFRKLNQHYLEKVTCIFFYHFFFFHILRFFDGMVSNLKMSWSFDLVCQIIPSIFFSLIVSYLWKPNGELTSMKKEITGYFQFVNKRRWTLKFMIGFIVFMPTFYIAKSLVTPFAEPYIYHLDNYVVFPNSELLMLVIYFFFSVIFVLVLMPIFILWEGSKTSLLFWIGFPVFIQGAVYPSLVEIWTPFGVRFPYLIQWTLIIYLMAIILVQLFYVPEESEIIDDQFKWMY